MERLTCILIDNEDFAIKRLQLLISKNIDYLDIAATYESPIEAVKGFLELKPDIIITDVEMPRMNGLDFLEIIRNTNIPTQPIIVSAYKEPEYFQKAIQLKLVEYLIKPITSTMLISAIESARDNIVNNRHHDLLPKLIENLHEEERIEFKTGNNGMLFEKRGDIIGLEADGRICYLYSKFQNQRTITESFAEIEERVINAQFVRIGRSHIINLKYVYEIIRKRRICILRFEQKVVEFQLSENSCNELANYMKDFKC